VREAEVALAFTADPWVEELHRHLADHGGARVRTLAVEPEALRDEAYDVVVAGHRWPGLTRAVVCDVHARRRAILGVHDREEPASRSHLIALGIDALIESDAGPDAFVRAIAGLAAGRADHADPAPPPAPAGRTGRLVCVGGGPGVGRTEIAVQLAVALAARARVALVDADDVAPAVASRLGLGIEPNLRGAIDAVEHGIGALAECCSAETCSGARVLAGLPNPGAWAQVRPGEVIRVVDRLADDVDVVVADGAGLLEDVTTRASRGRYATARALVAEADVIVVVADAAPHGIARALAWIVDARALAPGAPMVAVVNRAPAARYRRGELYEELMRSAPLVDTVFTPYDARVADAAWNGIPVARGGFTRAVGRIVTAVGVRA
jgi:MinD-like ATPase involved in chromosome partitioning or flagellar assembly